MDTPNEQGRSARGAAAKLMRAWKVGLWAIAVLLAAGILLRSLGVPVPPWLLAAAGAALAFVVILPALGGRLHEPKDSPFKQAPWGV